MRIRLPVAFLCVLYVANLAFADDLTIWPNNVSRANSDPWIAEHHDSIRQIRPRVLVVNF